MKDVKRLAGGLLAVLLLGAYLVPAVPVRADTGIVVEDDGILVGPEEREAPIAAGEPDGIGVSVEEATDALSCRVWDAKDEDPLVRYRVEARNDTEGDMELRLFFRREEDDGGKEGEPDGALLAPVPSSSILCPEGSPGVGAELWSGADPEPEAVELAWGTEVSGDGTLASFLSMVLPAGSRMEASFGLCPDTMPDRLVLAPVLVSGEGTAVPFGELAVDRADLEVPEEPVDLGGGTLGNSLSSFLSGMEAVTDVLSGPRITEVLDMDRENTMEFEPGTVTLEEALSLLPEEALVRFSDGTEGTVAIRWVPEDGGEGCRYRLAFAEGKYADDLDPGDLPYVDIYLDGISAAIVYDPNPTSTLKLDAYLGCTTDIVSYLESHADLYLGTPYNEILYAGSMASIEAACMNPGPYGGMNCTGFVAHVMRACGGDLTKLGTRNPGWYVNASNWNDLVDKQDIQSYKFDTIAEGLASGVLQKGDVIYFEPRNWGAAGADCHIGFFWGDSPTDNKFWHSTSHGIDKNAITAIMPKCDSYMYVFKNTYTPYGYLKVHKDSGLPDITAGNNCYSLKDAVYTVYSDAACTVSKGTLTTDANGDTGTLKLSPGTYYVKETTAPTGFKLDSTKYTAVVTTSHKETVPLVITSTDYPHHDPNTIRMTKLWDGRPTDPVPTLEGTQFTVKYYDGYYTKDTLPANHKRKWVLEIKEDGTGLYVAGFDEEHVVGDLSDALYYDETGAITIPQGTVTIQETKAAAGYTLEGYLSDADGNTISTDSELYVTQISTTSGMTAMAGGNKYEAFDTPIVSDIAVEKYTEEGEPLPGVTFTCADSDGTVVDTQVTDEEGVARFEELYPDVYTITETGTVPGYVLLAEPFDVEVPMRVTEGQIEEEGIDGERCIYDPADDIYYIHSLTYRVGDGSLFEYPVTGGTGTVPDYLPMCGGYLGIGLFSLSLFWRKRR